MATRPRKHLKQLRQKTRPDARSLTPAERIETFISEYKRETKPLRVPRIYSYVASGHRLAPGGKAELALTAHGPSFLSTGLARLKAARGKARRR
jgi:hypothetical protein